MDDYEEGEEGEGGGGVDEVCWPFFLYPLKSVYTASFKEFELKGREEGRGWSIA